MEKKLVKKLRLYWEEYEIARRTFIGKLMKIENKMNKDLKGLKLPKLEFFWIDGEPVGIGAVNYADRKRFNLIHDTELSKNENS